MIHQDTFSHSCRDGGLNVATEVSKGIKRAIDFDREIGHCQVEIYSDMRNLLESACIDQDSLLRLIRDCRHGKIRDRHESSS